MGFYAKHIFPVLMDLVCSNRKLGEHRRELLQPIRGSILEIGFGTGINLEYYPDRVQAINVVEPNAGMERRAAKRLKASAIQVGFHLGGAEKLPFENQIFDSVVSTFTLCSIPDVELALWEIHRVLKPAGRFYFLEHGLSEEPAVAERQIKLTPWQQRFADGCRLDRNMAKLVEGAGFRLLDLKKYYFRQSLKVFSYFYQGIAEKSGGTSHS